MTKYRIEFEIDKIDIRGLDVKELIVAEIKESIENYKQVKNLRVFEQ